MDQLTGPAIQALITMFGIGTVVGALLLGLFIINAVVVIKLVGRNNTGAADVKMDTKTAASADNLAVKLGNFNTSINSLATVLAALKSKGT